MTVRRRPIARFWRARSVGGRVVAWGVLTAALLLGAGCRERWAPPVTDDPEVRAIEQAAAGPMWPERLAAQRVGSAPARGWARATMGAAAAALPLPAPRSASGTNPLPAWPVWAADPIDRRAVRRNLMASLPLQLWESTTPGARPAVPPHEHHPPLSVARPPGLPDTSAAPVVVFVAPNCTLCAQARALWPSDIPVVWIAVDDRALPSWARTRRDALGRPLASLSTTDRRAVIDDVVRDPVFAHHWCAAVAHAPSPTERDRAWDACARALAEQGDAMHRLGALVAPVAVAADGRMRSGWADANDLRAWWRHRPDTAAVSAPAGPDL